MPNVDQIKQSKPLTIPLVETDSMRKTEGHVDFSGDKGPSPSCLLYPKSSVILTRGSVEFSIARIDESDNLFVSYLHVTPQVEQGRAQQQIGPEGWSTGVTVSVNELARMMEKITQPSDGSVQKPRTETRDDISKI